ncbi:DUF6858 family protein [Sulfurimonas sp. HSL3-7]|uniref:DUF6858 family protein n=1 Tax=Sulfonitrofixus jiaomeiensis TaxID=3131938 RepID=UPI0031FA38B3
MTQIQFKDEYPIFTMTLAKNETSVKTLSNILEQLRSNIEAHPVATYIGLFNHYEHTSGLESGEVSPEIIDAQNILFCFGKELLVPEVLAVRPRSIGIAERKNDFVISFLKAPNPAANEAMTTWTESLRDQ